MATQSEGEGENLPDAVPAASLEDLPREQRAAIVEVVEQTLSHSGPLPPPDQLHAYETAMPGLAERIVRLTEREQEHRHEIIAIAVRRNARLKDRGQVLGMVALALTLAFCTYLAAIGATQTAGAVAIGLVAAVVGIFVIGKRAEAAEAGTTSEG